MAPKSVKLPDGRTVIGPEVKINEQTERWSEVTLEDGSVLRVKPNVFSVIRLEGQFDANGDPLYAIQTSLVMIVASTLPHMKKGAVQGKAN